MRLAALRRLLSLALAAAALTLQAAPKPVVAVQPLGEVDAAVLAEVRSGILALYGVEVKILPALDLPGEAYYKPRARYRAEKLLDFLLGLPHGGAAKVVGVTEKDISTTKGEHVDWGIFGLGMLGGRACVVSTFRLKKGNASREIFLQRLVKVSNHELGHTLGLSHCTTPACLMEDAAGTIATVDRETGELCPACRALLGPIAKPPPAPPPASP